MKLPWQKSKPQKQQLEEQHERSEWLKEIEHTRGFRLILAMIAQNETWLRDKLENCSKDELAEYQSDLRAVKMWKFAFSRWDKEGEKAREILFGRTGPVEPTQFAVSGPNSNTPN